MPLLSPHAPTFHPGTDGAAKVYTTHSRARVQGTTSAPWHPEKRWKLPLEEEEAPCAVPSSACMSKNRAQHLGNLIPKRCQSLI